MVVIGPPVRPPAVSTWVTVPLPLSAMLFHALPSDRIHFHSPKARATEARPSMVSVPAGAMVPPPMLRMIVL